MKVELDRYHENMSREFDTHKQLHKLSQQKLQDADTLPRTSLLRKYRSMIYDI